MATLNPLAVVEHFHGHLGWLALVALAHPAIILRNPRRRAHLSVSLAAGLSTLAALVGVWLYPAYRLRLRQPIFASSRPLGYLFERKEHLVFASVLMAWAGAVTYFGAAHAAADVRFAMRRAAHWAFILSTAFALLAAVFATLVAAQRSF